MMVPRNSMRPCWRNTVATGSLTTSFLSMTFWKSGVSVIFRRTYRPTMTSSALARNGMRQP
ncbi:hypothetical protein D3C81_1315220 [compost metagenome]